MSPIGREDNKCLYWSCSGQRQHEDQGRYMRDDWLQWNCGSMLYVSCMFRYVYWVGLLGTMYASYGCHVHISFTSIRICFICVCVWAGARVWHINRRLLWMFYGHFCAHGRQKWAERLPKVMKWRQGWNTLQICPSRDSNWGGSDLWSNALPTRLWRRPQTYT